MLSYKGSRDWPARVIKVMTDQQKESLAIKKGVIK